MSKCPFEHDKNIGTKVGIGVSGTTITIAIHNERCTCDCKWCVRTKKQVLVEGSHRASGEVDKRTKCDLGALQPTPVRVSALSGPGAEGRQRVRPICSEGLGNRRHRATFAQC